MRTRHDCQQRGARKLRSLGVTTRLTTGFDVLTLFMRAIDVPESVSVSSMSLSRIALRSTGVEVPYRVVRA
jgi:hypothetical protein